MNATVPTTTIKSAATDLGVSVSTIHRWIKTGQIRDYGLDGVKVAGRWVIALIEAIPTLTGTAPAPVATPAPAPTVEARVRAAYAHLRVIRGSWVCLTPLRQMLADIPRDVLDATLRSMERKPDVALVPEANQKALTGQDRAAAVNIGEQDKHLIWIAA